MRIFAYSSTRKQSNKRSRARLKTENETKKNKNIYIYSILFFVALFRTLSPISVSHGVIFFLERVVGESENWQWIFPQTCWKFFECNLGTIGQNFLNKLFMQRSILPALDSLPTKLN